MLNQILNAVYEVPDLVLSLLRDYTLASVIFIIVFLIVLFFTNKVTHVLRELLVIAAIVVGVVGYFRNHYSWIWLAFFVLVILGIVRFIRYLIVTVRQNRINRRINERALAKAARRRGSWENKQGHSGEQREIYEGRPGKMDAAEVHDVVENETRDRQGANVDTNFSKDQKENGNDSELSAAEAKGVISSDGRMSRKAVQDAIDKLKDLRDAGVLTEEEFAQKKADLYARLG